MIAIINIGYPACYTNPLFNHRLNFGIIFIEKHGI